MITEFTPYEIALTHLEEAIIQHVDKKNYCVAITLAGVADEVFGKQLQGEEHTLDKITRELKEKYPHLLTSKNTPLSEAKDKDIKKDLNRVKNNLKHKHDKNFIHDLDPEIESITMLARALRNLHFIKTKEAENAYTSNVTIIRGCKLIIEYSKT